LLDIAGILAEDQGLEVLDGPIDAASLPFQRRLTLAIQLVYIRIDPDEDPIAHLRIHNPCADTRYSHQ